MTEKVTVLNRHNCDFNSSYKTWVIFEIIIKKRHEYGHFSVSQN